MLRAALLSLLVAAAQPAIAACPEWLVSDMEASAVPVAEIARMCGTAPSRSIAPAPPPAAFAPAPAPAPPPAAFAPAPAPAPPPAAFAPAPAPAPPPATLFGAQRGMALGAMSGASPAAPARSVRCVAERGEACTVPSPRPLGSPCWCGGKEDPREGTIR
jgi:hypothetical protein